VASGPQARAPVLAFLRIGSAALPHLMEQRPAAMDEARTSTPDHA
jgi:hypothetical protein